MYSTILLYLFVVPNAWLPRDRKEVPRRETELAELIPLEIGKHYESGTNIYPIHCTNRV